MTKATEIKKLPIIEEIKEIIPVIEIEETKEQEVIGSNKVEINFIGRGFETLEDAKNFVNTDYFKNLGKADQDEYLNWLKS